MQNVGGGGGGGGANKVHYGRCASDVFIFECKFNKNRTKEKVLCERREARKDKQTTEYKKTYAGSYEWKIKLLENSDDLLCCEGNF